MKIKNEDRYNKLQREKSRMPKHGMSNFLLEDLTNGSVKKPKSKKKKSGR